jgi:hypothetical protein
MLKRAQKPLQKNENPSGQVNKQQHRTPLGCLVGEAKNHWLTPAPRLGR